jgi:hypothetical protein
VGETKSITFILCILCLVGWGGGGGWPLTTRARFMVCLGDAESKPSPEGVKLALGHLGVTTAAFVGDTPDDMRAAVAVGGPVLFPRLAAVPYPPYHRR